MINTQLCKTTRHTTGNADKRNGKAVPHMKNSLLKTKNQEAKT